MSFDLEDYAKRQKHIKYLAIGGLVISLISFLLAGGIITDKNTQTVLEFLCMTSAMVFVFGLYCSFTAWFEKKMELDREKITNDSK